MDEARRERIKTIFDKHTAPDRRIALLGEISSRVVAQNDTLTTIELLEWLLQNIFAIDLIVAFSPDRKTAVRFEMGIASCEKKNAPILAKMAYRGHFLARKTQNEIISYGKRIFKFPDDFEWRMLLQLEILSPVPFSILLKDRKILDILKQQFPTEQWVMGSINKFPKTPPDAPQIEEEWEEVQMFETELINPLLGRVNEIHRVVKMAAEQTQDAGWKKFDEDFENIQKKSDSSKTIFDLDKQSINDPVNAEVNIRAQLERDPRQDILWLMLGSLLAGEFRWEDALHAFTKAKDLDPTELFCKDCISIALDALGKGSYQGKWEVKEFKDSVRELKESTFRNINNLDVIDGDEENVHRTECVQRTLKALILHYYQKDPKKGEELIEKMLSKCNFEGKISFFNDMAWKLYSRHTTNPRLLDIGKTLVARGVALAKKNNSKLLVCCLDSQACLASLLGEYKESQRLFEEALPLNQGGEDLITWAEFARVLKALGDDVNYKKYNKFFWSFVSPFRLSSVI